jgi:predicted DNA-binding protein (UPF0251 family)
MMETITVTGREQIRVPVVMQVMMGELKVEEAAATLTLSKRQVQRIVAGYRERGPAVVVHGNRGRQPGGGGGLCARAPRPGPPAPPPHRAKP